MSFAKRESIVGQACSLIFIRKHKISWVTNHFYSPPKVHGFGVSIGVAKRTINGGSSGCVSL
jgi:hypothetical protein